ncbi:MAG: S1 RNA-binding domain-containing protein [Nanoarchaeota archaeon]|nr:S1 RNA-binding domain-containing protein [Nanoarchaeota archaeon]
MLLIKEGFPEEDELVLCTVTNIHFHSVFAKLDEYGKTGLIHISEISPGRIRNIRDFVVEGKKIVCKVLRVDKKTGHIDLSLRRVNGNQKKKKINEIKQEQKAEKIIELVAKNNNSELKDLYNKITPKIFQKYDNLASCFKDVVKNESLLEKLEIEKEIARQLIEIIKVRFKEEEITIGGSLKLRSYQPDGIDIIKKVLEEVQKIDKSITLTYSGGGTYKIEIKSNNYKDAEKILDKAVKKATVLSEKADSEAEFIRKEKE